MYRSLYIILVADKLQTGICVSVFWTRGIKEEEKGGHNFFSRKKKCYDLTASRLP